jgi:GTPase Era involved in 16S rRNA processing
MDESRAYYYIPIIGTISAGKSTFLKALLGIDFLEIGESTTTRFICLIKNSKETKFYHVIPKKVEEETYYEKEGEEINKEKEITKKIEEINKDLSDKEKNTNDIFYMLEVPFKHIDNKLLLEQCYFMDIPGLNEDFNFYIEKISSLITINNILFEIMVFDSTSIDSDNILEIFLKLEKKNCLKKKNNLFILNKIDHCRSEGEDNIIDKFKQIFYERFEKEKSNKEEKIFININENQFLPMNSLLYMAESRINDDFSYCLLFELFEYLEYKKISNDSYYKYIQKKVKFFIQNNNLKINDYSNKLNDKDNKVINKSIEYLTEMTSYIKKDNDFHLGKKRNLEDIEKLYYIYKNHNYHHSSFKFNDQIQEFLNNLQINSTTSQEECKSNEIQNKNVLIIEEFEKFLDDTFKVIDPRNEMGIFKISLQSLRENILGKNLRIAFIGNINVGKSTILNCIIGKDILPTKETECTYRGIIIRHMNTEEFRLYKTKLFRKGKGLDEYYFFETDEKPYCIGDDKIKSYLNNKNNDKEIEDNDAFITIEGKLKIFDFISLSKELINSIEFIDLPGLDKKENKFNEEYYQKILKFSNCCIYINEPKYIDDELSKQNMKKQYLSDKEKVFPELKNGFIKTCLFLINKSENLNDNKKSDIRKNIFNIMKTEEKDLKLDEMNISFFSGKSVIYSMEIYNSYVNILEKSPILLFNKIFKDFKKAHYFYKFEDFSNYINDELSKIEEQLDLDLDDDENKVSEHFNNQLNQCLSKFEKENYININENDKNNIIQKLYNLNQQIKSKNFEKTEYSLSFFKDLEKSIKNAGDLQNKNLNNRLEEFVSYTDD